MDRITLNWKDITKDVKSYEYNAVKTIDRFWIRASNPIYHIYYINWAEYITWRDDVVEIMEEIKKPKFKIGDYVVKEAPIWNFYKKIHKIKVVDWVFFYNPEWCLYDSENSLRKPTQEELDIYFR